MPQFSIYIVGIMPPLTSWGGVMKIELINIYEVCNNEGYRNAQEEISNSVFRSNFD